MQSVRIAIEGGKAHVSWRNGQQTWERSLSRTDLEHEIKVQAHGSLRETLVEALRRLVTPSATYPSNHSVWPPT